MKTINLFNTKKYLLPILLALCCRLQPVMASAPPIKESDMITAKELFDNTTFCCGLNKFPNDGNTICIVLENLSTDSIKAINDNDRNFLMYMDGDGPEVLYTSLKIDANYRFNVRSNNTILGEVFLQVFLTYIKTGTGVELKLSKESKASYYKGDVRYEIDDLDIFKKINIDLRVDNNFIITGIQLKKPFIFEHPIISVCVFLGVSFLLKKLYNRYSRKIRNKRL